MKESKSSFNRKVIELTRSGVNRTPEEEFAPRSPGGGLRSHGKRPLGPSCYASVCVSGRIRAGFLRRPDLLSQCEGLLLLMVSDSIWMPVMLRGACEWLPAPNVQAHTKVESTVQGRV